MSNSFGTLFRLTTFGESHGPAIGGVIDGCPPGIHIDIDKIVRQLSRRRPGQSAVTTSRREPDNVHILSGVHNEYTTGAPLAFIIENTDTHSADYDNIARAFRPGHADFTYYYKYRGYNDVRGGGRSSARDTACRVVGGAVASMVLASICPDLRIKSYTKSIGSVSLPANAIYPDSDTVDSNPVRCPDSEFAQQMERLILDVKSSGDTVGGVVECVIRGVPVGIGEPVYNKLSASLAAAMMSINAAKGFEIGMGFEGSTHKGSEVCDNWIEAPGTPRGVRTASNFSGGIQGGISNGEDIVFRVAFKPVATLLHDVETVGPDGKAVTLHAKGRHDPCVVPRAVPVVEAMASMVLLDQILIARARSI